MLKGEPQRYLIYSQDVGGASFLLPVLKQIWSPGKRANAVPVIHPLSRQLFTEYNIFNYIPVETIGPLPLSVEAWQAFLANEQVTSIFCTTSSKFQDMTNCNLIVAAHKLQIRTLGVMDHWKGYDRFLENDIPRYLPDQICCIDPACERQFLKLGMPRQGIHVVGHPGIERIYSRAPLIYPEDQKVRVLLVSQPLTRNNAFKGIFFQKVDGRRLIDMLAETLFAYRSAYGCEVFLRFHPKEQEIEKLPEGITPDPLASWQASLGASHVVIGMDSMALLEAVAAGKTCFALSLPGLAEKPAFKYSTCFETVEQLQAALDNTLKTRRAASRPVELPPTLYKDATQRAAAVVQAFFQEKA